MLHERFYDSYVWSLKYRPKTVDDLILPSRFITQIKSIIKSGNVPNMLFAGSAGTGKTSAAIVIADALGQESLYINASEESGIDVLRTKLKRFASTVAIDGAKKLVILDEVDRASSALQDGLKSFLEEFTKNVSFIFISNHKNRIIPPLVSRVQSLDFVYTAEDKKEVQKAFAARIKYILNAEKVTFEPAAVGYIIKPLFPDFRKILNELQKIASQGNGITASTTSENCVVDMESVFTALSKKDYSTIKKVVCGTTIDFANFYTDLFNVVEQYVDGNSIPQAVVTIAQHSYQTQFVADPRITMLACMVELMTQCKYSV